MTDLLQHRLGRSLVAHASGEDLPRWRYAYGGVPKPYLHPIATPAGVELTGFQPHSHPWHRGLWFTFKYVNGENFWEEDVPEGHGTQVTVEPPLVGHPRPGATTIMSRILWTRPDGDTVVAVEGRQITLAPLGEDALAIDWVTDITATADLTLDRTPFTTWGGYGGIAFRATRAMRRSRMLFPGGETSERPTGEAAPWCDLAGALDGGVGATGGVAILDHPGNLRHPSPWYGAAGTMNFVNAALLFHEPYDLAEGAELALRYRVVVHDGLWDPDRIQEVWEDWAGPDR